MPRKNQRRRHGSMRPVSERIITRVLFDRDDHRAGALHLYKPIIIGPDEWICTYRLRFRNGRRHSGAGHGGDSLHALLQALEASRRRLDIITPGVRWAGGEQGAHGVPMFIPLVFGLAFERRLQNLVNGKVDAFGQALERRHRSSDRSTSR